MWIVCWEGDWRLVFSLFKGGSFRVFAPHFGGNEVHTAGVNCRLAGQHVKVADH